VTSGLHLLTDYNNNNNNRSLGSCSRKAGLDNVTMHIHTIKYVKYIITVTQPKMFVQIGLDILMYSTILCIILEVLAIKIKT